ncbi:MAG TPA: EAL domain-containing protein [Burkholderiaceae bacterium]|nr:EAL domain-containing protein [Burkholderiaceae bacterium]
MAPMKLSSGDPAWSHLAAIYAVLSATNEALLHATTTDELYPKVCEAAVESGKFLMMAVAIPDLDSGRIRIVASAGAQSRQVSVGVAISVVDDVPYGQGLVGIAFRSRRPSFSNDFLNDPRTAPWHQMAASQGVQSGAAVPLLREQRVLGVLLFYSAEKNAFEEETLGLIERMARNIAFALQNFAREEERKQAAQQQRLLEAKYRRILETIEDAYYEVDLKGSIVQCNGAFGRLTGYSESELDGQNYREIQPPETASRVYQTFNTVYRTGVPTPSFDWEMLHKNGHLVVGEGSVQLVRDAAGKPIGFAGILRDVTERRQIEQALRDSEARFRALTNLSSDWYWEQDAELRYTRMESRHATSSAIQRTFVGRRPWETELEMHAPGGWQAHQMLLEAHQPFRDVIMFRQLANDTPYYISVSGEPMFDRHDNFTGYRGVSREITNQKIAEARIQHLATHDSLTGLPNRAMFNQLLSHALTAAQRYQRLCAVLFIDLDRFKFINDTLGHVAGDQLLQEVTRRFKKALRGSDVVARLGGDEFVVLIPEMNGPEQATTVARKLLSAAIKPVVLLERECRVTASIGIALYPRDGEDEQTLMKNADIAMYFAKSEGKNNYQFYSNDITSQTLERLTLENNLRHAMARNEFTLHYQAKRDLKKGTITGVEALLRWDNPELGSVSPAQFIPAAEETGLIVQIGKWVLRTACLQNIAWQQQGLPAICMAVNLSVRQFSDEDLLCDLGEILAETGMAPELLELEITEGMVIQNPAQAVKLLSAIKALGVRLAIDDFGTGYSSLGQLKNFPIDTLKVDRSFIRDLATNTEDKAITEAIIAMGKTLSLTVVAEGVETEEQEAFLRAHACDEMQGYYFSRPIPSDEFAELLRAHVPLPS